MLETTREAARHATAGARAMVKREHRPYRPTRRPAAESRIRSNVLPRYGSREQLEAAARRQAALAGGEQRFVVQSRMLSVGLPLGLAAGVIAWQAGRSSRGRGVAKFVAAFAATMGLMLLEARAEWRGIEEAGDA